MCRIGVGICVLLVLFVVWVGVVYLSQVCSSRLWKFVCVVGVVDVLVLGVFQLQLMLSIGMCLVVCCRKFRLMVLGLVGLIYMIGLFSLFSRCCMVCRCIGIGFVVFESNCQKVSMMCDLVLRKCLDNCVQVCFNVFVNVDFSLLECLLVLLCVVFSVS